MSFNAPRREEYDGAEILYLSSMDNTFFRKIVIDKTRSFDLSPPVSSGTKDRRETREAAIESSRQDDSNQYLIFS